MIVQKSKLNTIFEQGGKVYAICSHNVPNRDLAKFISTELRCMAKFPRAQMRIVTTDEFKKMPFGRPKTNKEVDSDSRESSGS